MIADAFVRHYELLDATAAQILEAAYTGCGLLDGVKALPLLKYLKTNTRQEQEGLLAWAIDTAEPIREAIETQPVHLLAAHIKNGQDTDLFMRAFADKQFGRGRETFEKGPAYWKRVPGLKAKWTEAGLKTNAVVQEICAMLTTLGYNRDRSCDQIAQLKTAVTEGLKNKPIPPQIVTSPYSTGKTVLAVSVACVLAKLKPAATIWLVALTDADAIQHHEFLKRKGIDAQVATVDEDFERRFASRMLCTTHWMVAKFADTKASGLDVHCIVDEVDRLSECEQNPLGFVGAKSIIPNVSFFYGVCADELTKAEQEGLGCPPETRYVRMGSEEGSEFPVRVDTITLEGPALYQHLVQLVWEQQRKLVLCVEKAEDISPAIQALSKAGMAKDRIVAYNPEDTGSKSQEQWQVVDRLMTEPELRDVVVTWEAGNRSKNYFAACYPVALFQFQQQKELHQLMGRSIRDLQLLRAVREFRGALVDNEATRARQRARNQEEAVRAQ